MPRPQVVQTPPMDDDARCRALAARDARFDGHFFIGVTSTGIYCRPVCRVRVPKRANCRFFDLAASERWKPWRSYAVVGAWAQV